MKSSIETLRLWAYQYGFWIRPQNLLPPARLYKLDSLHFPPALKHDYIPPENQTKKEIQARSLINLAREHYNKRQTQKAQENLDKALLLAKSAPNNEFSPDLMFDIHFLRGYIMLQKKKLWSAELNFKIFLQLREQYSTPYTVRDAQVQLELLNLQISHRGVPNSIEKILNSLTDKTDPEQLYVQVQCHRALIKIYDEVRFDDSVITHAGKCLEILEIPEVKNSYLRLEIGEIKLELAKVLVKKCEAVLNYRPGLCLGSFLKIAKVLQDTKADIQSFREEFGFILSKYFELCVKLGKNTKITQEFFGILQEVKIEEKDFPLKSQYIEHVISVADGMLSLEYYSEGSKLLNQISEELDNCSVSYEKLAIYFYLKSQFEYENKNYEKVLYYKRLYQETKLKKPFENGWDHKELKSYIVGIKANVKLEKLDEAVDEVPVYLDESFAAYKSMSDFDDGSRVDLREFLAKNIGDNRWEKWLKELKDDEKENEEWTSRNRDSFVRLNFLMLCARNKQFSLAEDCAIAIKESKDRVQLTTDFAKKSDFIVSSSVVKDCLELIEDHQLKGDAYLVSLIGLLPMFSRRKLVRGNIFILEEIERIIQACNPSLPFTVKLQTIKAVVYSDLEEWGVMVEFLAETIRHIEENNYVDDFVPVLLNLYGNALLNSGQEGESYLEKGRNMVKEMSFSEKCKKQNLDGYNSIIYQQKQENKDKKVVEKVSN